MPAPLPDSLRLLAAHLPFALDDTARVGEAFRTWRTHRRSTSERSTSERSTSEKRDVDIWTYCFVQRYFLAKISARQASPASDFDALAEQAHRKIEQGRAGVREPRRYPHWVSVVCKNTYLNYLRRDLPRTLSLHAEHRPPLPTGGDLARSCDLGLAREVVAGAIRRLPRYLQPVARLRFLETRPYEAISEKTNTPVPTARAYAARVRRRLCEDPAVQALRQGPPR